jgi:hypothetical protein
VGICRGKEQGQFDTGLNLHLIPNVIFHRLSLPRAFGSEMEVQVAGNWISLVVGKMASASPLSAPFFLPWNITHPLSGNAGSRMEGSLDTCVETPTLIQRIPPATFTYFPLPDVARLPGFYHCFF